MLPTILASTSHSYSTTECPFFLHHLLCAALTQSVCCHIDHILHSFAGKHGSYSDLAMLADMNTHLTVAIANRARQNEIHQASSCWSLARLVGESNGVDDGGDPCRAMCGRNGEHASERATAAARAIGNAKVITP